jgi:[ribosomal protein S5]-alanine N-acetyltransferase
MVTFVPLSMVTDRPKLKPLQQSARVYVRDMAASDCKEYLLVVHASREFHRPWVYPPETQSAFKAYLRATKSGTCVRLLICRRSDDRIAGLASLSQIFRGGFQNAYLGFWASAEFAGQGYMTEGLSLVLRHAFNTLKLHRLEANIQPANERSKALIKRCGFRYEGYSPRYLKVGGLWRDHERWAMHREDWLSQVGARS